MRSLIQPGRSLVQNRSASSAQRVLFSYSRANRYPRRETALSGNVSRISRCASSSSTSTATNSHPSADGEREQITPANSVPPEEPEGDDASAVQEKPQDVEKSKRPRKARVAESEPDASLRLPPELNILWTPDKLGQRSLSALPPQEIFQEVLTDLLITLHPQTQHRAAYPTSSGPPIEPTLALYCPFEGGEYVVDETVKELARRTDSDVVVLDAVHLAAGEWGQFGKAAAVLDLPQNPLHFKAPPSRGSSSSHASEDDYDEDEDEHYGRGYAPSHMTVHVVPSPGYGRRQTVIPNSPQMSAFKSKGLFDELINTPTVMDTQSILQGKRRPRLIYIRDYPTLAPSALHWYPSLLASVRQRRQGHISRPSSPVANATTIIFGITPSIVPPAMPSSPSGQSMLGLINAHQSSPSVVNPPPKWGRHDFGEDEHAEKSREKRLRDRLKRWERDEQALIDEMPRLPINSEGSEIASDRAGLVVLGGPSLQPGAPTALLSAFQGRPAERDDIPDNSRFFRSCILVPSMRNLALERSNRVARRREINELTMRMGVGAIGGRLEGSFPIEDAELLQSAESGGESANKIDAEALNSAKMWDEWGKQIESWSNVKDIADRVVGTVIASNQSLIRTLDPTPVPWSAVVGAWVERSSLREIRRAWLQESSLKLGRERDIPEECMKPKQDEVIQHVRDDPDLTPHEQRLLGCIVDAASMPTSFSQVHLPPHTIDSVRTIVSLPLLYPSAFQSGILKQHTMKGCLLFGPPGTGKTLVIRALAKEAGCRMLAIQPSDVMDMYVGEGEKLVRAVFSLARRLSPCVIFLDEIDALFGARSSARETGGALAHHGILTEFMQEMDGLKTSRDSNIVVIGATNRPFDLDDAVLRRLPRRLLVDLPRESERKEILKIHLRDEILATDVDLDWLARRTELFSGSDLKHLCVSAALDAVKEGIDLPWAVPSYEDGDQNTSSQEILDTGDNKSVSDAPKDVADNTTDSWKSNRVARSASLDDARSTSRVLYLRHFTKALKEITPSSSETLGSLSALRKWNDEFGEGQRKKRVIMWGKGKFGFAEPGADVLQDGRISK